MTGSSLDAPPPQGAVPMLTRALAFLGGAALLFAGCVTTLSVLLRWTTDHPVRGDFEIVSIAAGVGVAGFLAHGTLMRTNIIVDTFTTWLPARVTVMSWADADAAPRPARPTARIVVTNAFIAAPLVKTPVWTPLFHEGSADRLNTDMRKIHESPRRSASSTSEKAAEGWRRLG